MTRRKIIFYNDFNNSYIVSEAYSGDKSEMEQLGCGTCDHTWAAFMEAMDSVDNLPDFLKVISWITASYHQQANHLPGTRLSIAHNNQELYALVRNMDEVWEVRRGVCGARQFDMSSIAPIISDGKNTANIEDGAIVTHHAEKRIRQRLGINKSAVDRTAEKALQYGITHAETKGKLSRHLDGIFLLNYKPTNLRVYNHSVYLFNGTTLITVLLLPKKFWVYADKLQRKKRERKGDADANKETSECGIP